ncbi:MAG: insulinase family protein, partial [Actinomycetes bacterium]
MVLHRDEVDGVPVYWSQGSEPLSATLLFRVGVRDETFRTCGVTHLVEHLAMSTLGRRRHQYNASVDVTYTEFAASGRPEGVLAYLSDVCAALTKLPMDRLGTEAKVLAAEEGNSVHPAVGELLRQRHGQRALGLAGVSPPALDQIDAGTVTAHARRFFVRENAALALTGPPPAGL